MLDKQMWYPWQHNGCFMPNIVRTKETTFNTKKIFNVDIWLPPLAQNVDAIH